MDDRLRYQIWARCWWKKGEEGQWELDAAFSTENPARLWAEKWYGASENECVDGRLLWQLRIWRAS